jgi:hypothetical protein
MRVRRSGAPRSIVAAPAFDLRFLGDLARACDLWDSA